MSAPVFLLADTPLRPGTTVVLAGPEGRHAARVQRLRTGERLRLTDGSGSMAEGAVLAVGSDRLEVALDSVTTVDPPLPRFVVVQALAKGARGELAVAMLTEVGADVLVPWAAERCVARWEGERGRRSLERWRTAAREAAKQARRSRFPEVTTLADTREVGALLRSSSRGVVLHEAAGEPLAAVSLPDDGDVVVVVGPEGGISAGELAVFATAGARVGRLGPTVLRTSTAGPAALAVLLSRTARWT